MDDILPWHVFYDSRFLKPLQTAPNHLIISNQGAVDGWPRFPCPELSECMTLLESFIKNESTWVSCHCSTAELGSIQHDLNELLRFLNIEKKYAADYWHLEPRRVASSLTHFYTFVQILLKSLIPDDAMTLLQTKAAGKLCLEFDLLKTLFNSFLKNINPIAVFLSTDELEPQSRVIYNLFQNICSLLHKAPNIRKDRLFHVHPLTQYISYINNIEINKRLLRPFSKYFMTPTTTSSTFDGSNHKTHHRQIEEKATSFFSRCPARSKTVQPSRQSPEDHQSIIPQIFSFLKSIFLTQVKPIKPKRISWLALCKCNSLKLSKRKTIPNHSKIRKKYLSVFAQQDRNERALKKRLKEKEKKLSSCKDPDYEKEDERKQPLQFSKMYTQFTIEAQAPPVQPHQRTKSYLICRQSNIQKWGIVRKFVWGRVQSRKIKSIIWN